MSAIHPQMPAAAAPEKYLIAFVIQGDDVFKITSDNIIHTTGTASGPAFDAIAKLKAAAALLELTNRHKERPDELRQMARELAGEGMKLMARASSTLQPPPAVQDPIQESARESAQGSGIAPQTASVSAAEPESAAARPAPLPKLEQSPEDESALPGNSPTNAKIALISG